MSQLAFKTLLNSYWSNRGDGKCSWNLNYLTGRAGQSCLSIFLCRFLLFRCAGENWKIGCSLWISLQKPMWHPRKAGIGHSSSPAGQPRCRRHFKSETTEVLQLSAGCWFPEIDRCASVVGGVHWDKAGLPSAFTYLRTVYTCNFFKVHELMG